MKKFAFVLALCFVAGSAMASTPTAFQAGTGGAPNVVPSGRDVCWTEPADLNGLIGSSEQILSQGLETEIANDFVPTDKVIAVTYWGGFWNNSTPCASGITTPGFNLKFYDDAGCIPGSNVAWLVNPTFTETSVGCQAGTYPMFKWDFTGLCVDLTPGSLYWFGGQMADHVFPPQSGRLAAAVITSCDSVFKGAIFGYPDWTPCVDVFGVAFDASQEFTCGVCGDVPTQPSTWGQIKGLYR